MYLHTCWTRPLKILTKALTRGDAKPNHDELGFVFFDQKFLSVLSCSFFSKTMAKKEGK